MPPTGTRQLATKRPAIIEVDDGIETRACAVTRSGADFGADVRPALATNRPNAAEGDLSDRESVGLSSLGPT
jgi:hypothetical protein